MQENYTAKIGIWCDVQYSTSYQGGYLVGYKNVQDSVSLSIVFQENKKPAIIIAGVNCENWHDKIRNTNDVNNYVITEL